MNKRPPSLEGTNDASEGRLRSQSDVIAIVLLLGMIFVSATAVIVMGGILVDSVQDNSRHQLAVDSAVQTHQQITEVLQSGQARELAVSDAVDMRVENTGHLSIEMLNQSGAACSTNAPRVAPVETDLGAIIYETPRGAVIYEGGAIWERTDGGLATRRAPPVSYDGDTARIAVQTVTAEADDFEGEMAAPNEHLQQAMVRNTTDMLTNCPARSYTTIQLSITSPYHELWAAHFDRSVATDPANVTVTHDVATETVTATIENATSPHASRGLRFQNISAPTVVGHPSSKIPDTQFFVDSEIANDGYSTREANLTLRIDGVGAAIHPDTPRAVPPSGAGTVFMNFTTGSGFAPNALTWGGLANANGLATGQLHGYNLTLRDGYGDVVSSVESEFFLAKKNGGGLTLAGTTPSLDTAHDDLQVNATLVNTGLTNDSTDVTFNITDERVSMTAATVTDVGVAKHGGVSEVGFQVDVGSLPAGIYEYNVSANGETITDTFTISNRSQSNLVGELLVTRVDHSNGTVSTTDPFGVTVGVLNLGDAAGSGEISLDVEGLAATNATVAVPSQVEQNVTLGYTSSDLDALEPGQLHNYTVSLTGDDGGQFTTNGSFYLGEPGQTPVVENTSASGNQSVINATIANHGLSNVTDDVSLTLYAQDGSELGSVTTDPYTLVPGESRSLAFDLNATSLAGSYEYNVTFGDDTAFGAINYSGVSGGDDDVTITAPGNGTVTVLGTEISNKHPACNCKSWWPVSVSSVLQIDGEQTTHQFYNNATDDPGSLHDMRNLNSYDTQLETYSYNWTQVEGETATLTVASTLWNRPWNDYHFVNQRTSDGETWYDYHPPEWAWDYPFNPVNASAGENPSNVRVLLDGDQVPNVNTANPYQRSAAEVLNEGAADRVDDDGTLDLGPNEAIFLFELSDLDATWSEADQSAGDPDYNDVIVLVGFNPDNPGSVDFSVDNGTSLVIGPADPSAGNESGQQVIGGVNDSVDEGGANDPTPPQPQNPNPGSPSEPDEIDVDVGGVVIG